MKSIVLILVCLYFFLFCSCIDKKTTFINEVTLNNNYAYLVFRGTNTKEGFFARDFNLHDTLSSHIGIAVYENNTWIVYHVLNSKFKKNDLIHDELKHFFDRRKQKIKSASIWVIENLNPYEIASLKLDLKKYKSLIIKFDRDFSLSNDSTKLYCSELIFNVLHKANPKKFNFKLYKKKLKPIYSTYLRRDTLHYYPVDAFQLNENIRLIKEWTFFDNNGYKKISK